MSYQSFSSRSECAAAHFARTKPASPVTLISAVCSKHKVRVQCWSGRTRPEVLTHYRQHNGYINAAVISTIRHGVLRTALAGSERNRWAPTHRPNRPHPRSDCLTNCAGRIPFADGGVRRPPQTGSTPDYATASRNCGDLVNLRAAAS